MLASGVIVKDRDNLGRLQTHGGDTTEVGRRSGRPVQRARCLCPAVLHTRATRSSRNEPSRAIPTTPMGSWVLPRVVGVGRSDGDCPTFFRVSIFLDTCLGVFVICWPKVTPPPMGTPIGGRCRRRRFFPPLEAVPSVRRHKQDGPDLPACERGPQPPARSRRFRRSGLSWDTRQDAPRIPGRPYPDSASGDNVKKRHNHPPRRRGVEKR